MKFGSVCSGIEAASAAWTPLGWRSAFFSEIEPFPCAVLKHHYPNTPNLGDMTKFKDWPDATLDVLCGGTPCQSFSNAGLRAGLDDPRGQLMLTFGAIAARYRPRWLVWENVPGVLSSNGGRDFGAFLGLLGFLGYGFAYRVLDAQFVRVDGYARAVPQRRQRVFVVGCLGDWRSAAAVLLEREGLRGDPAPRRRSGARVAGTLEASIARGRGAGTSPACIEVAGALAGTGPGAGWRIGPDEAAAGQLVAATITSQIGEQTGQDARNGNLIAFDTTQITSRENRANPQPGDPCHPLAAGAHPPAIAIRTAQTGANGIGVSEGASHTLDSSNGQAIAFNARQDPINGPINGPIDCDGSTNGVLVPQMRVRRLMPVECERLQGFPDGYTAINWRGKPAADGPRYKALGNSWAVNCARWLGRRIEAVESIKPHNGQLSGVPR